MIIKSISIRKQGYYGYGKRPTGDEPYLAHIEVESPHGEVKLNIDAERTKAVVALIADMIAEAGRETANAMTAEVVNGTATMIGAE
jgi:hypothetical protein